MSNEKLREAAEKLWARGPKFPAASTVDIEDGIAVFRDEHGNPVAWMNPDDFEIVRAYFQFADGPVKFESNFLGKPGYVGKVKL